MTNSEQKNCIFMFGRNSEVLESCLLVGKEKNTLTCLSTKEKTRQGNWNYNKKTKEDAH